MLPYGGNRLPRFVGATLAVAREQAVICGPAPEAAYKTGIIPPGDREFRPYGEYRRPSHLPYDLANETFI